MVSLHEGLAWQRAEIWGVTEVAGQAVDVLGEGAWQKGWLARVASKTARWRLWEGQASTSSSPGQATLQGKIVKSTD